MTTRAQGRARGTVCVWCGEGREAERGRGEAPEDAPRPRPPRRPEPAVVEVVGPDPDGDPIARPVGGALRWRRLPVLDSPSVDRYGLLRPDVVLRPACPDLALELP